MIEVKKEGILLSKTNFSFEVAGVLNPAVIAVDNIIHVFYRAVAVGNFSSIGYCKLLSPLVVDHRDESPLLIAETEDEKHGIEDPRIVKIDNTYYLTYTAYDGVNALGALATSTDLIHWERKGLIVPKIHFKDFILNSDIDEKSYPKYTRFNDPNRHYENLSEDLYMWIKNIFFFPRRINNKLCFLIRIKPDIQIVNSIDSIEDLTTEFWESYFKSFSEKIVLAPKHDHEINYIGGGCPPIETKDGWLLIYHGVHDTVNGYVYSACAALLDLENPQKEIARLPYPLFFPEKEWELKGEVNNVCFPNGAVVHEDTLYIYYGAADERIGVASMDLPSLLAELLLHKA